MMWRCVALLTVVAGVAAPAALRAQARECEWTADQFKNTQIRPNENMTEWQGSVRFECSDGTTLSADRAVRYDWMQEFQFSGNVMYRDSLRIMTADYLSQRGETNETYAQGSVVVTDLESGTVIRGSIMQMWGVSETRAEPLTVVRGRPTAVFQQSMRLTGEAPPLADGSSEVPRPAEPVQVVADSMQIVGTTLFRAFGRVDIRTATGQGSASAADYFQDEERFRLRGNARYEDRGNTMTADTLHFWMAAGEPVAFAAHPRATLIADGMNVVGDSIHGEIEGGQPRRVNVQGNATLTGEDGQVDAWRVTIEFEGDAVSVLRAVGWSRSGTTAGGRGAVAESAADSLSHLARIRTADFQLAADSIDASAPGGVIQEVHAIGNAYAERLLTSTDSTAASGSPDGAVAGEPGVADPPDGADAPRSGSGLPDILARDWVRGDTVIAVFETDTTAAADSAEVAPEPVEDGATAAPRRVLRKMTATGAGDVLASAVYRMAGRPGEPPTIHYVRSSTIDLAFQDGQIATADFGNPVYGRSFQPLAAIAPAFVEGADAAASGAVQVPSNGESRAEPRESEAGTATEAESP